MNNMNIFNANLLDISSKWKINEIFYPSSEKLKDNNGIETSGLKKIEFVYVLALKLLT